MNGQQSGGAPGHAFISYVREDRERVDRLQAVLEEAGIRVWRDTANLWPGQDWKIEIRKAIVADSLAFIACFSENTAARTTSYQNEELVLAVEQMRLRVPGRAWLIPVRFAECATPPFDLGAGRMLDSLQHVDLFDGSWEPGIPRLVHAVLGILQAASASPVKQPRPGTSGPSGESVDPPSRPPGGYRAPLYQLADDGEPGYPAAAPAESPNEFRSGLTRRLLQWLALLSAVSYVSWVLLPAHLVSFWLVWIMYCGPVLLFAPVFLVRGRGPRRGGGQELPAEYLRTEYRDRRPHGWG